MEIGIYGLGRFGIYYSGLLSKHFNVKATSRNPERQAPQDVQRVTEDELLDLDVIIFCVAISAFRDLLQRIGPRLKAGTLIMDTCSVKVLPVQWMREHVTDEVDILATHPIFGPDSGRIGVNGLPIILCPERIGAERYEQWRALYASLGLRVLEMSADDHDREAALTQGLTHYLGRVLAELNLEPSPIASVGYQKLLEIIEQTCNDSWQLFSDLQQFNPFTQDMRRALNRSLKDIAQYLDGRELKS
jgi:prephenate dehydrogenase